MIILTLNLFEDDEPTNNDIFHNTNTVHAQSPDPQNYSKLDNMLMAEGGEWPDLEVFAIAFYTNSPRTGEKINLIWSLAWPKESRDLSLHRKVWLENTMYGHNIHNIG